LQVILIGCLLLTLAKVAVSQPALDGIQLNTQYLNKHCQAYLDTNNQQGFDQVVCIGIIWG
jgi:hypothetical protein